MHESTWFATVAGDSVFLSSNLLLLAAYPVSLARFMSLWVEYECDIPLFNFTSSIKGSHNINFDEKEGREKTILRK